MGRGVHRRGLVRRLHSTPYAAFERVLHRMGRGGFGGRVSSSERPDPGQHAGHHNSKIPGCAADGFAHGTTRFIRTSRCRSERETPPIRDESLLTTLVGQHPRRDHIRSRRLTPRRMAPPPGADRRASRAPLPRHGGARAASLRDDAPARPRRQQISLRRKRLRK